MLLKKSFQCFLSTPQDSPPHPRHAQDTPQMHTERNKAYFIPLNSLPVGCPEFSFLPSSLGVFREEPLQTGFSAQTPGLGRPGGVGMLGALPSLLVWSLSSSPCWPQPSPPSSWGRGQWLSGQRGAPPAAFSSPVEKNCPLWLYIESASKSHLREQTTELYVPLQKKDTNSNTSMVTYGIHSHPRASWRSPAHKTSSVLKLSCKYQKDQRMYHLTKGTLSFLLHAQKALGVCVCVYFYVCFTLHVLAWILQCWDLQMATGFLSST